MGVKFSIDKGYQVFVQVEYIKVAEDEWILADEEKIDNEDKST